MITRNSNQEQSIRTEIFNHINGTKTMRDEYRLVLEKKSKLSRACRDYLINYFEELKQENMTKEEALQEMKNGAVIRHVLFASSQFIFMLD
jgi:hypothetical protein